MKPGQLMAFGLKHQFVVGKKRLQNLKHGPSTYCVGGEVEYWRKKETARATTMRLSSFSLTPAPPLWFPPNHLAQQSI